MPKVFIWQMCHNVLLIRGVLLKRGYNLDPKCQLCAENIEPIDNLFTECPFTRKAQELAQKYKWIPSNILSSITHSWMSTLRTLNKACQPKILQNLSFLLWSIWKIWNGVIFKNDIFNPMACIIGAKKASAEWRIRTCMSVDKFFWGSSSTPTSSSKFVR